MVCTPVCRRGLVLSTAGRDKFRPSCNMHKYTKQDEVNSMPMYLHPTPHCPSGVFDSGICERRAGTRAAPEKLMLHVCCSRIHQTHSKKLLIHNGNELLSVLTKCPDLCTNSRSHATRSCSTADVAHNTKA
jgi:hypothetical protein